jgi:NitT/TauT family transport system substrate-binding protein
VSTPVFPDLTRRNRSRPVPIISRRTALVSGAALLASSTVKAQTRVPVRVGYVPVIGAAPLFVLNGAGWAREAGLDLALTKFESGPPAIQALASGTLDVLFVGIAPIAVARSKGLGVKVVAASGIGGSGFAVQPDLAHSFEASAGDPKAAFATFRAKTGRAAKIGALPPGGTPTVALLHWLKRADVRREDYQIVSMGIEAVQQAMLVGAVDGGTVLEPSLTLVQGRKPGIKTIAYATQMFPDLPGVVVSATDAFSGANPDAVVTLVRLAIRARDLILADPKAAAGFVQPVLAGGLVEAGVFEAALKSPGISFVVDPRGIVEATRTSLAFEVEIGDFPTAPSIEGLFDPSYYLKASGQAS